MRGDADRNKGWIQRRGKRVEKGIRLAGVFPSHGPRSFANDSLATFFQNDDDERKVRFRQSVTDAYREVSAISLAHDRNSGTCFQDG